jgi:hypothetical protein
MASHGYPRQVWRNRSGDEVVESYTIPQMAHGTPLAAGDSHDRCGFPAPSCSRWEFRRPYHIAKFWGLTQFYRENAKYKERTYTFVERIGIERIRAVVVDDSEGIAQALDAAMQASIEATYDPWTEAAAPKTANQFASLIPAGGD